MAILYKTDSTIQNVSPANGTDFKYKELTAFVEGMVEIVPLPSGRLMVVNEEGKLNGLKINLRATDVWKAEYPIEQYPHNNDELIVGVALVCESNEIK